MALTIYVLSHLFSNDREAAVQATTDHAPQITETPENIFEAMADAGAPEINYTPAYSALDPLTNVSNASSASLFNPQDDYWGLPRSEGYDLVAAYCSACHSLRIVMQQKQNRDGWDYLLTWMVEQQGMGELYPDDRDQVLEYLTREFGQEE